MVALGDGVFAIVMTLLRAFGVEKTTRRKTNFPLEGHPALVPSRARGDTGVRFSRGVGMRRSLPFVVAVALVAAAAVAACDDDGAAATAGSGNVVTETRDVSGFEEIDVRGSGEVVVDVTGTESLTVEADDNILPLLETEVHGGVLVLSVESNIDPTVGPKYTITAATLQGVSIAGSGDVTASAVDVDRLEVDIAGSGDVSPTGTAGELLVSIAGSGRYQGEDLVAATGSVNVSGSGNAVVNVTDELDVDIAGSGNVEYMGSPTLTQSISGSGEVSQN